MAAGNNKPLARTDDLLAERVGVELVVYDTQSKHAHHLGALASWVFTHCDGDTPARELAELASRELDEPVTLERVDAVLADLESLSLLMPTAAGSVSRRTMVRRTALAGAAVLATPYVTSVTTAQAAACNLTKGCDKNSVCDVNTCTSDQCLCKCADGFVPTGSSGEAEKCHPSGGIDHMNGKCACTVPTK
jgi:Coenzyme PQQ synthesis protein D (PqqD)